MRQQWRMQVNVNNTHWTLLVAFMQEKEIHYYDRFAFLLRFYPLILGCMFTNIIPMMHVYKYHSYEQAYHQYLTRRSDFTAA